MRRAIMLLMVGCAAGGCARGEAAGTAASDPVALQDTIGSLMDEVVAAAEAADAEAILGHYRFESGFASANQGRLQLDTQAFEDNVRRAYGGLRGQSFDTRTRSIQVLTPDVVVATIQGPRTATDTSGVFTEPHPFAATMVWRRGDDGWKIVAQHQSFGEAAANSSQQ